MKKVTDLRLVRNDRLITVEEAWDRYVSAMERSKETLRLEDGIAAGKAYADFVRLFDGASYGRR